MVIASNCAPTWSGQIPPGAAPAATCTGRVGGGGMGRRAAYDAFETGKVCRAELNDARTRIWACASTRWSPPAGRAGFRAASLAEPLTASRSPSPTASAPSPRWCFDALRHGFSGLRVRSAPRSSPSWNWPAFWPRWLIGGAYMWARTLGVHRALKDERQRAARLQKLLADETLARGEAAPATRQLSRTSD